jgi:hypothetical protein
VVDFLPGQLAQKSGEREMTSGTEDFAPHFVERRLDKVVGEVQMIGILYHRYDILYSLCSLWHNEKS